MADDPRPIELHSEVDATGQVSFVWIRFGPHYGVKVRRKRDRFTFELVATHHGFRADATEIGGELERLIEEVRRAHPETSLD